jgi:NAD(P)H-hydrate repair Nnr-like enzyme with NAD(P)H-hydrate dehydratase domain
MPTQSSLAPEWKPAPGFCASALKRMTDAQLVIDAGAIEALRKSRGHHRFDGNAVVTPHAGEMASLMGVSKEDVEDDAIKWATEASAQLNAVVALKGRRHSSLIHREKCFAIAEAV